VKGTQLYSVTKSKCSCMLKGIA